jgi:signal transduction histidine kinase
MAFTAPCRKRRRVVLERVQNNGKHLLALINDVLDPAKIEAGQLTLILEDYSLPELLRGVVVATEPLAAAKGLKFIATVADGLPLAHGDARRVSQVLLNSSAMRSNSPPWVRSRSALRPKAGSSC